MSFVQRGPVAGRPSSPHAVPTPVASVPANVPSSAPVAFDQLGLTPDLLRTVAAQGYTEPTPVQAQAIPIVLSGRDLLAGAQTGTGKTAAFVLPILQLLHASRPAVGNQPGTRVGRGATGLPIRCLVLAPTRELALQVEESVRTYGAARPVASTTIYGGVGFQPQVRALRAGPEIVVATPGRLLDHAGQGTIDLSSIEILVLDEADRMLDMGFIRDIRRILGLIPERRQNLLFSATFSDEIRDLAAGFLHDPAHVQIARRNAPIELVRQVVYPVDRGRKRELLSHLIREGRIDRALVFTRTKHGANRLAEQLDQDGILAAAIHGNKSQGQRVRALDDFKAGRVAVLVATEIAARGLDIDGLPHVVNYELPMVAQDYVHRIGRTGRAGMEGDAVSLVCIDESSLLDEIQQLLRGPIRREVVPGFEVNRSIPREPIRQRSDGVSRPSDSRRTPSRRPGESRPPVGARRPNGSGPAAAPRAASGGFNTSQPVEPRRAPAGAYRRPMPNDFSRSEPASRASAGPRTSTGVRAPAAAGTSIGYAPSLRPAGYPGPGSRHGSQFRPAPGSGNRPQNARRSTGGNQPDDRREHASMPGERIARSGGRPA